MNEKGIASTADAVVFLVLMLVATGVMYGLMDAGGGDAYEQENLMVQARWSALSLVEIPMGEGNASLGSCLAMERLPDAENAHEEARKLIVPSLSFNITMETPEGVLVLGEKPSGNVGSWSLAVGNSTLSVKVFRS